LLAYLVRSRRRELAVRLAIGAEPRHLLRRVLGEAAVMVAAGAVIGLAASVALTRLLRAVLVSVERVDLMSVSTGALTIGLVGLVAALGPAVAAARVAPSEVLRDE
jgi:ABC-type antimicrobial peptide transport system permease subunit